eukprot:242626-Chlamydomonas_euryale.AAC.2
MRTGWAPATARASGRRVPALSGSRRQRTSSRGRWRGQKCGGRCGELFQLCQEATANGRTAGAAGEDMSLLGARCGEKCGGLFQLCEGAAADGRAAGAA